MSDTHSAAYDRFLRAAHKTVFAVDRAADRILKEAFGGTFSQFLIMMATDQCPGSQADIAEFLDLTPAAISRQIDGLVASGYIERNPDPASRRSHIVTLTDAGKQRLHDMHTILLTSFNDAAKLSESELHQASDTLEKVVSSIESKRS